MEIVPGIHRVDETLGVNCYLLETEKGWLIVDTGLPGQENKILNYLTKLDIQPSMLALIILTHGDIDHIGCIKALKKALGTKTAIHSADAAVLAGKRPFKTINNFLKPAVKVMFSLLPYKPVEPDILLEDDSNLYGWQVIHTPGHTPGSISLFQPGKCIVVGDALRTDRQGNPRPISRRICLDLAQARQSLIKISELNYEVLLPGHGEPMLKNASSIVCDMVKKVTSKKLNNKKIMGIY